jgi:SAM-dependent methyltransferase
MISERLLAIVRCPDCRGELAGPAGDLICRTCGHRYRGGDGYLDLRPGVSFAEQTKYLDESLHADARHHTISPPLLSAAIRNDILRRFLRLGPEDRVIDLGCGSGRALMWNRDLGAWAAGVDISPFFAMEARRDVDLLLGDLRRLPFADATFTKAWSLDVLEHLSPTALEEMLREAGRVLAPGGAFFVYSHVRRNSHLALGLRGINRLARALDRIGLIDLTQERLRKSDHVNPLADLAALHRAAGDAGLRVARIRYYTPLVGGFVENIVVRLAERVMARRAARRRGAAGAADSGAWKRGRAGGGFGDVAAAREARASAKRRIARRGPTYLALKGLTLLMRLDVLLFGRVPSGPFFALLVKDRRPGPRTSRERPAAAGG